MAIPPPGRSIAHEPGARALEPITMSGISPTGSRAPSSFSTAGRAHTLTSTGISVSGACSSARNRMTAFSLNPRKLSRLSVVGPIGLGGSASMPVRDTTPGGRPSRLRATWPE